MQRKVHLRGIVVLCSTWCLAVTMAIALGGASVADSAPSPTPTTMPDHRLAFPYIPGNTERWEYHLPLIEKNYTGLPPIELPVVWAKLFDSLAKAHSDSLLAGFVAADGARLVLRGEPYYFLGTNATQLMLPYFPEGAIEPVIRYLAETGGVNAIRIWFLPGQNADRFERILDLGAKYGIRYVVSLQNYHYYKTQGWFAHRYVDNDLPHVRALVTRFRDRPEILMWELMNEPGCGPENGSEECTDHMYAWAAAVSAEIKALDPHHLVSIGTTLRGWTDHEQANYERMHALSTVDVVSIHRRVGKEAKGEMRVAERLNKPVFVGEAYRIAYDRECRPINGEVLAKRAEYIAQDLAWSFGHGLDGYLLWQHSPGQIEMADGGYQWFCEAEGTPTDRLPVTTQPSDCSSR